MWVLTLFLMLGLKMRRDYLDLSKPMLKAPHVGADAVVDAGAKDEKRLSGSR